ncbi:hypothetical protein LZ31DRAFT_553402 [Colletotrichum somersetense]|nr:hypothetical protein LZ31DRAFT_553402 [Colletotrichum somersetense]
MPMAFPILTGIFIERIYKIASVQYAIFSKTPRQQNAKAFHSCPCSCAVSTMRACIPSF